EPEKVLAATCSSDLFRVLGVAPAAGRGFVYDDDRPGAARVAIRGHGLWLPLRLSRSQPPNPAIRAEAYRQYRILRVVARLGGGATLERARAELAGVGGQLAREYP